MDVFGKFVCKGTQFLLVDLCCLALLFVLFFGYCAAHVLLLFRDDKI